MPPPGSAQQPPLGPGGWGLQPPGASSGRPPSGGLAPSGLAQVRGAGRQGGVGWGACVYVCAHACVRMCFVRVCVTSAQPSMQEQPHAMSTHTECVSAVLCRCTQRHLQEHATAAARRASAPTAALLGLLALLPPRAPAQVQPHPHEFQVPCAQQCVPYDWVLKRAARFSSPHRFPFLNAAGGGGGRGVCSRAGRGRADGVRTRGHVCACGRGAGRAYGGACRACP